MIWARGGDPSLGFGRFYLGRSAFLLLLGLSYAAAFHSLAGQVLPLFGQSGILPLDERLSFLTEARGEERFLLSPSVLWWGVSDHALRVICWSGFGLAVLLAAGVLVPVVLPALWILYLSLVSLGAPFLSFQWDALLLESGFLAMLVAPSALFPSRKDESEPWRPAVWIVHLLLFKLMFSSGIVKLTSGDPTWRELTALSHHFMTQPLPNVVAWWIHQWPLLLHRFGTFLVLTLEIAVPFLILGPRRLRHWAGVLLLVLQFGIVLTGSYGFFNLLTMGLCLFLFDDAAWPSWARRLYYDGPRDAQQGLTTWGFWNRVLRAALLLPLALLMVLRVGQCVGDVWIPGPIRPIVRAVEPLRIVNGYGLFAVMTTARPELVFEGSVDGIIWEPYLFRYKPSEPGRAPYAAWWGHMPRLDWQLWFAALGGSDRNPWVRELVTAMLEGRPEVLSLLEENPFPNTPPRFVRVRVWDYRFTTVEEREATGDWWVRENERVYLPGVMLAPRVALPGS